MHARKLEAYATIWEAGRIADHDKPGANVYHIRQATDRQRENDRVAWLLPDSFSVKPEEDPIS